MPIYSRARNILVPHYYNETLMRAGQADLSHEDLAL